MPFPPVSERTPPQATKGNCLCAIRVQTKETARISWEAAVSPLLTAWGSRAAGPSSPLCSLGLSFIGHSSAAKAT